MTPSELHIVVRTIDDVVRTRLAPTARSLDERSRFVRIAAQMTQRLEARLDAMDETFQREEA